MERSIKRLAAIRTATGNRLFSARVVIVYRKNCALSLSLSLSRTHGRSIALEISKRGVFCMENTQDIIRYDRKARTGRALRGVLNSVSLFPSFDPSKCRDADGGGCREQEVAGTCPEARGEQNKGARIGRRGERGRRRTEGSFDSSFPRPRNEREARSGFTTLEGAASSQRIISLRVISLSHPSPRASIISILARRMMTRDERRPPR